MTTNAGHQSGGSSDNFQQWRRAVMHKKPKGKLMIIGGNEKSDDDMTVLEAIAKEIRQKRHPLLLVTVATYSPDGTPNEYIKIFQDLGVKQVDVLDIRSRDEAYEEANVKKVEDACAIFFTGGDQLRITSQIGDSLVYRTMLERYIDGCLIVGTSAGAAAMPNTMINGGPSDESNRISSLSMAPGLGLIDGVVIDSHFAERGRMGRLLGAVAQNPKNIGLGIDEGTAILVEHGEHFSVIGPGAVYVVDGTGISYSSLSEKSAEGVVTIYDVKVHVMGEGESFDLLERRPVQRAELHAEVSANGSGS
jgi:cyanophycinase